MLMVASSRTSAYHVKTITRTPTASGAFQAPVAMRGHPRSHGRRLQDFVYILNDSPRAGSGGAPRALPGRARRARRPPDPLPHPQMPPAPTGSPSAGAVSPARESDDTAGRVWGTETILNAMLSNVNVLQGCSVHCRWSCRAGMSAWQRAAADLDGGPCGARLVNRAWLCGVACDLAQAQAAAGGKS